MHDDFIPNPIYMQKAIELAFLGGGNVHPNPLVGAVIVKDNKIIAQGFHHVYGNLHAERDALKNAAENNVNVKDADLYVTLEPCCHTGKQPPCTQAIIDSGIKNVIIGSRDPNSLVNGKGVLQLKNAGINVVQDFLKEECDSINEIFFYYITKKIPFVIVKTAQTVDGKTSLSTGASKWITNEKSRNFVHHLRGTTSCVMCGIQTVLKDNPLLTCRIQGDQYKQPTRVVLDSSLQIPLDCNLVQTANKIPLIVFSCTTNEKQEALEKLGVKVIQVEKKDNHINIEQVLKKLGELSFDSVLVESGGTLNSSLFFFGEQKKCLVNKVYCFIAPKILGGKSSSIHTCVQGLECDSLESCVQLSEPKIKVFGNDVLLEYDVLEG